MNEDALLDPEKLALLRLSLVSGIGPRLTQNLLTGFGNATEIFSAPGDLLRQVEGIGPKLAAAILAAKHLDEAEQQWDRCRKSGVELVFRGEESYPPSLEKICDPPSVFYRHGTWEPRDTLAIAIVGSRRCTLYGKQQAERLAGSLAQAGFTVVSGLARGIDGAAHQGAIAVGGRTLAVLGTGLANIYPPEHVELAKRVSNSGAVLSESPLDQAPKPGLFPQRNRIISGLSLGVIVVEAARNSGALHTARHAMEQGREVFAVPGRIDCPASAGCHDLIRDGATLIRHVDDVLESLGPLAMPVRTTASAEFHSPRELSLSEQERKILHLVPNEATLTDDILNQADIEPSRVLATLTVLEMRRMIRRLPGGQVVRL